MALVSVVIPVYNAEKYLRRMFESVLNQTFTDIEVIVPAQPRVPLRKARLQISGFYSFGGCAALACIIFPVGDFRNTLY